VNVINKNIKMLNKEELEIMRENAKVHKKVFDAIRETVKE
jgi:methionine aminopeptidase